MYSQASVSCKVVGVAEKPGDCSGHPGSQRLNLRRALLLVIGLTEKGCPGSQEGHRRCCERKWAQKPRFTTLGADGRKGF